MREPQVDYEKMWKETLKALSERKRAEVGYFELLHDVGELLPYMARLTDTNELHKLDLIDQNKYYKTLLLLLKLCKELCEKYDLELEDVNEELT